MLQKEVVDRICATPGKKQFGRLSVMTQYYCSAEKLFEVSPSSFKPIPKVISAVIKVTPLSKPNRAREFALFQKLVSQAFSQRRKTLKNTLKPLLLEQQLIDAGIDPGHRAETLSVDDFIRLSNLLS